MNTSDAVRVVYAAERIVARVWWSYTPAERATLTARIDSGRSRPGYPRGDG